MRQQGPDGFPSPPNARRTRSLPLISFPPRLKVLISHKIRCCSVLAAVENNDFKKKTPGSRWHMIGDQWMRRRRRSGGDAEVHLLLINPPLHTVCSVSVGAVCGASNITQRVNHSGDTDYVCAALDSSRLK